MSYTKAELEAKNKELKGRIAELEAKNSELEDAKVTLQKRIEAMEEQVQFYEAAVKSANEDADTQRQKVAELKAKLGIDEPKPRLSPGCQEFLDQAKQMPKKETIISTDAIISAAEISQSSEDNPFMDSFMSRVAAQSVDSVANDRNYIELDGSGDDNDDDDNNDDDDGCEDAGEGAPYGRSASGEFLDPDEEE